MLTILWLAVRTRKHVRGVADFLVAGRVAGRYVISVGDLQVMLSVLTLVAMCESYYQCGMAISFWNNLLIPVSIFMSLTGFVLYRYRQTASLSMGQFLETRYNRPLRIVAAAIRTVAEMLTNSIGPAVAARFFIYFFGLPLSCELFGVKISTFAIVVIITLLLAMLVIWPGGRISLLVTDSIQGLMSYPIFVIFTVFILSEISWQADVAPVMLSRVPGESFLNPMDISALRDFNLFALAVTLIGSILNRGAWIGNDISGAGRTAHEQKMAGILGAWRNGFSMLMMTLLVLFLITMMTSARFEPQAAKVRNDLIAKVSAETIAGRELQQDIRLAAEKISRDPAARTVTQPYSRNHNPDTPYLDAVQSSLMRAADTATGDEKGRISGEYNAIFQQFRTLYFQMMMPVMSRQIFPIGLAGVFALLLIMLMLSTDSGRIFNASATLVQDVVMPLRRNPFEPSEHLRWLRGMSAGVCIFFFIASLFFAQLDYIHMFCSIMCALWLGAAGPIMLGGLYTRWGTSAGAFAALVCGSGTSFIGLICQRNWADAIYPFLSRTGYLDTVNAVFGFVTDCCSPWVEWRMDPYKFPVNSVEITFVAMAAGCLSYVAVSLVSCKVPYNLDRMLHRGKYDLSGETRTVSAWNWRNVYAKMIGITDEYTRGDRVIAWSVFGYSVVYQFLIAFVGVLIWNMISPWPAQWWSYYFFITLVVVGIIVGSVSTVWFMVGGIIDLKRLFMDLAAKADNPLDDGWVEGNVALVDKAGFEAIEKKSPPL
ncbi:MAG: sodium:panthothenate symporter [Victivallaceae bacterium]